MRGTFRLAADEVKRPHHENHQLRDETYFYDGYSTQEAKKAYQRQ